MRHLAKDRDISLQLTFKWLGIKNRHTLLYPQYGEAWDRYGTVLAKGDSLGRYWDVPCAVLSAFLWL